MIRCAWCHSDQLCTEKEQPPPWTFRKCPECEKMNKFRPIDTWDEDGLKRTEIVSEMLSASVPYNATEMPSSWNTGPVSRATDAELGRAIQNIIKRSKKP